jgi:alcohol dehydrogenase
MRALYFEGVGRLRFREVPAPLIEAPEQALVRPLAIARCDLDVGIVRGRAPFRGRLLHRAREAFPALLPNVPFRPPFAFAHECVAEVVALGDAVRSVGIGDRVVVPFQISCGRCDRCVRGLTGSCSAVAPAASFGLGRGFDGVAAEIVRVPFADAMLIAAPDRIPSVELASAGDNVADGYRTVAAPLGARPGAPVLVVGGEAVSVGLYAVLAAIALGSEVVDYVDPDRERCQVAESLGARIVDRRYRKQAIAYPITVDASADPEGLAAAIVSTEPFGTCTSVGIYFARRTPFPLRTAFMNGITFRTSRVCSRAELPAVLALVRDGRLVPSKIRTRVARFEDAPEAFLDPAAKVVVEGPS